MSDTLTQSRFQRIRTLAGIREGTVNISGIAESRSAAIAGLIATERNGQILMLASSYGKAKRLAEDLSFFVPKNNIYLMPEEERSLFSFDAKSHEALVDRLSVLIPLAQSKDVIVVSSIGSALKSIAPRSLFLKHVIDVTPGLEMDLEDVKQRLFQMGYERTGFVEAKGQYSLRGGILDVFPPNQRYPCRVEFFDTEVDSLRLFDPTTQRSVETISEIRIFPAELIVRSEFLFEQAATRIRESHESFGKKLSGEKREHLAARESKILEAIETGTNLQLLENHTHYFYPAATFLWDYLVPGGCVIIDDPDRVMETLDATETEFMEDFKTLLERGDAIPDDIKAFSGAKDYVDLYQKKPVFLLTPFQKQIRGVTRLLDSISVASRQATVFNGRMDFLETELLRYGVQGYQIRIVCSSGDRVDNMKDFLQRIGMEGKASVEIGQVSGGMEFPEEKVALLSDKDIFLRVKQKTGRRDADGHGSIKAFTDIRHGDFVVHENHGIGKFLGVVQLEVQEVRKDYLKIKYAGEDLLYIPVEQMDIVQKYVGTDGATPKVSKLSGGEWKKTKAKAKAAIQDLAVELIALSAARQLEQGHGFSKDSLWQREFEDLFPYEETPDQLRSIREIKRDMEKVIPMDRLLCGDVGYGKTEVAARAVFKCVADGKQAAILVPTTLLANQHYYTFKERFESFPFQVEMLSRFRDEKQQTAILDKAKKGAIDILIGTHRLLSKDVVFRDLGLLVIDEEQRFGVQHKEAIKQLRKSVDVLTLSATPIPRTLHMSLLGIRDMSLIEEPPEERYPVQTYVMEQEDAILKEAIQRELDRGGQIYIVYNRVRGIQRVASHIRDLVPEASIAVGHGQMDEKQLEDVMLNFVSGDTNILVATTIIESGLDIPNVNTMIILDADHFGLSQLYQLRGRVGRSNRMAYAYLMYQKNKVLTETAEKRLRAIREFTEFGAGFHIAMRDLEIRGAGNLLGTEQHGHMMMVGYELYCKLVEDAVREMSGGLEEHRPEQETSVELPVEALIPSTYIEDELLKLQVYKKIASIREETDRSEIIDELLDRFGDMPKATMNLIDIACIKAASQKAGITRVREEQKKLIFDFELMSRLHPEGMTELSQEYGMGMLIHGGRQPFIRVNPKTNDRLKEAREFLTKLAR